MDYKLSIADERLLAGLAGAVAAANAARQPDEQMADGAAYLDFVIGDALEGYAKAYADTPTAVKEWVSKQADPVAAVQVVKAAIDAEVNAAE